MMNFKKAAKNRILQPLMESRKLYGFKKKFVTRKIKSSKLRYFSIYIQRLYDEEQRQVRKIMIEISKKKA